MAGRCRSFSQQATKDIDRNVPSVLGLSTHTPLPRGVGCIIAPRPQRRDGAFRRVVGCTGPKIPGAMEGRQSC